MRCRLGLPTVPSDRDHAIVERLRRTHGLHVSVGALEGALRRYDPSTRSFTLSEQLPRESQGFHLAFQLMLLEAKDEIEAEVALIAPSSTEAASLLRLGLLNYMAAAVLLPYERVLEAASTLRHDVQALSERFGMSYEQICQRLSSLQRPGARGVPFFFLRVDPAGNVSKRFSAAGFPLRAVRRIVSTLGGARGVRAAGADPRPGGAATGRGDVPVLRARGHGAGGAVGRAGTDACDRDGMRCGARRVAGVCGRDRSGAGDGGDRAVVPVMRPGGMPEPGVSAAGTSTGARPGAGKC